MKAVKKPLARQSNFDDRNSNMSSQSLKNQHCQKHMVPEEKRKRNGRVNGSLKLNRSKLATPEEKRKGKRKHCTEYRSRKKNGRVSGSGHA